MPKITVDGKTIECKDRQMILQACLDAGIEVPHYCYHPGLSIVASCRICLAEIEGGPPKLVPTCQTPVRDGMVVHTRSSKAIANQKQVMEYLLVNHPLDCPVCDQAGECSLQDYSYKYGRSESRFEEDKYKKPKKDIGEHIMLYNDRCIMCTRCVRFTREVAGTAELFVDGRGSKEEIEIFPGKPLNNNLSGNVVDLCPVGALLDKEFLFKQRVWFLKSVPSVSPADAGGENIWVHYNEGKVYRLKPRYNADVNKWWISNDTRYSYKAILPENRLYGAQKKQHGTQVDAPFFEAIAHADAELKKQHAEHGDGSLYAVLSPMLACEEAYLLAKYIRSVDPQATLVLGPVPSAAKDEVFRHYNTKQETFRIQAEKVPNRRGIERVMAMFGGPTLTWSELAGNPPATLKAGWITAGYHSAWIGADVPDILKRGFRVVQDLHASSLTQSADVLLPSAAWVEKDGTWENYQNRLQIFAQAFPPKDGAMVEGNVFARLLGRGRYEAQKVRDEMGEPFSTVALPSTEEHAEPAPEFVEI